MLDSKRLLGSVAGLAVFGGLATGVLRFWQLIALAVGAFAVSVAADALRRRAGRNLRLRLERSRVRRGEELDVRLRVVDPGRAGRELQVGLVCDVRYSVRERDSDGDPTRRHESAVAHEEWADVAPGAAGSAVRLGVPRNAPFSHEGTELEFTWKVVARDVRRHALDPTAELALEVLP